MSIKLKSITWLLLWQVNLAKVHGKRKCDLKDPGSMYKAPSSFKIENWPSAACEYLPCCNNLKYDGLKESYYQVLIEYGLIIVLNRNCVNWVLTVSSSIVQQQTSLKIRLIQDIKQGGFAWISEFLNTH